jgi:hypothetical protein
VGDRAHLHLQVPGIKTWNPGAILRNPAYCSLQCRDKDCRCLPPRAKKTRTCRSQSTHWMGWGWWVWGRYPEQPVEKTTYLYCMPMLGKVLKVIWPASFHVLRNRYHLLHLTDEETEAQRLIQALTPVRRNVHLIPKSVLYTVPPSETGSGTAQDYEDITRWLFLQPLTNPVHLYWNRICKCQQHSRGWLLWTEYCIPLKFIYWSPNPQCGCIWRQSVRRW